MNSSGVCTQSWGSNKTTHHHYHPHCSTPSPHQSSWYSVPHPSLSMNHLEIKRSSAILSRPSSTSDLQDTACLSGSTSQTLINNPHSSNSASVPSSFSSPQLSISSSPSSSSSPCSFSLSSSSSDPSSPTTSTSSSPPLPSTDTLSLVTPIGPQNANENIGIGLRLSLSSKSKNTSALSISIPPQQRYGHTLQPSQLFLDSTLAADPYPNGPVLVREPNIYLFSEPSLEIASQFDVIINVAKEAPNPFTANDNDDKNNVSNNNNIANTSDKFNKKTPEYYYVPWDHKSTLYDDLVWLTELIEQKSAENKSILIHCQCGVSRSASLVVAYIMKRDGLDLNQAYEFVKLRSPHISPNMSLMFQLMDWSRLLHNSSPASD